MEKQAWRLIFSTKTRHFMEKICSQLSFSTKPRIFVDKTVPAITGSGTSYFIGVNPKPRALKGLSDIFACAKSPGPGRSADADF